MQYELFQSKLKHSVDGALLSDIIRSSSSGRNSHCTAAMELMFERSIHARRERTFTKVEDSLGPDPMPRPMRIYEGPSIPFLQVQFPVPATAFHPPPQSLPNADANASIKTSLTPASAKDEAHKIHKLSRNPQRGPK